MPATFRHLPDVFYDPMLDVERVHSFASNNNVAIQKAYSKLVMKLANAGLVGSREVRAFEWRRTAERVASAVGRVAGSYPNNNHVGMTLTMVKAVRSKRRACKSLHGSTSARRRSCRSLIFI